LLPESGTPRGIAGGAKLVSFDKCGQRAGGLKKRKSFLAAGLNELSWRARPAAAPLKRRERPCYFGARGVDCGML